MEGFRYRLTTAFLVPFFLLVAVAPSVAQLDPGGPDLNGGVLGKAPAAVKNPVTVDAQFTAPAADKPGRLFVTTVIAPGWHIYSITQPTSEKGNPTVTKIAVKLPEGVHLSGPFKPSVAPEKKTEPDAYGDLPIETHAGIVTWYASIELPAGVDPAMLKIAGTIFFGACDANSCVPPQYLAFTASLGKGVVVIPRQPLALVDQPLQAAKTALDLNALKISGDSKIRETPLAWIILLGFLGGLILNLMPCVLPVIGLKLLSFLEQSGHRWQRALALNLWYSLGLISVFLVLATLAVTLGLGWGQLFGYSGFDIALAAVVFAMGLSFLGVWEIPIPGFVGRGKTLELAEKEGAAGAFVKGVLTTLLATPCGAPLLASALTWAVVQPPIKTYAVFTAAGLGMASPYLVIGAFAPLITFIPKPGAWMDTLKEIMGFLLLGTVVFLLTFIPWQLVVPTVGFFFGLWAACWWIGRLSPLADAGAKFRRWLSAAAFAAAIGFVTLGWLANIMQERFDTKVEQAIADRLARTETSGSREAARDASRLPWQPFTRKALEEATASGSTVLVDFTADWCLTCKTLEAAVLNTRPVAEVVKANGVLAMHADWTRTPPEITKMLELLGSKQVPVLAIFPAGNPNEPVVLRGGYTQATLLEALKKAGPSRKP